MATTVEGRLTRLEEQSRAAAQRLDALSSGQDELRREVHSGMEVARLQLSDFVDEWRKTRSTEAEQQAEDLKQQVAVAAGDRLTVVQIVGMGAALFGVAVGLVGGNMYLIRAEGESARAEMRRVDTALSTKIEAESAKTALQVRGQQDTLTATQTGLQSMQRDMSGMAVKLGLVEAIAGRNADAHKEISNYDALLARQEERHRALQDEVRGLAQRLAR